MSISHAAAPGEERTRVAVPHVFAAKSAESAREVTRRTRFLVAGLGALAPILANLVFVDPKTVFVSMTVLVLFGYALKISILFGIGGAMAFMHPDERSLVKLFQLGVAGPALITGVLNGAAAGGHGLAASTVTEASAPAAIYATSHAAGAPQQAVLSFRQAPDESVVQQLLRGLTGSSSHGSWFVCLHDGFGSPGEAFAFAGNVQQKGLNARVFGGDGPLPGRYVVVVGAWLNSDDAQQVEAQARSRGLNPFVWSK